jgi:hypothetical protein
MSAPPKYLGINEPVGIHIGESTQYLDTTFKHSSQVGFSSTGINLSGSWGTLIYIYRITLDSSADMAYVCPTEHKNTPTLDVKNIRHKTHHTLV